MTTISTSVSYPVGVRVILMKEAARRRRLERAIVERLEERGYGEIILPIVDFVDPYTSVIREPSLRQTYRFTDREGELVAVRSDFTPMVARALAPVIRAEDLPLRVFYRGDVIRCDRTRLGTTREFFQIGAELVGDASVGADVEAVLLAARAVASSDRATAIALTDSQLVDRLLDAAGLEGLRRSGVRTALAEKRTPLLSGGGEAEALLLRLASGSVTLGDLAGFGATAEAASRLDQVSRALGAEGFAVLVNLDEVESETGYYDGLVFRVFADGERAPVARGGRYDAFYRHFGADVPAIGFTISVDYLEER